MTGFGAADGTVGPVHVAVELRSVNHRFFNATMRLPAEFSRWEGDVRESLRRVVSRGHVSLTARIDRGGDGPPAIDEVRFGAYVELLRGLRDRYALEGDVDLATVLRMPDVLASAAEGTDEEGRELVRLVGTAVEALRGAREEEGARLASYLLERLSIVEGALQRITSRAPERLVEQRDRLRESVRVLCDGVAIDEQRVAMEIAVLADRLDVHEELSRFASHIAAFRHTLQGTGSDPVGKRLGFLLQEMLREANTTGSKANDAAMLYDVVTIKEELERIREQVENLE